MLDEADRLLDMGFKAQLDAVMGRLPRQRRTGLFSATQTEAVEALMRAGLRNPVRVNVAVTAAGGGGSGGGAAAAANGGGGGAAAGGSGAEQGQQGQQQATPTTLSLQFVTCEVDEKMGQLVRAETHDWGRGVAEQRVAALSLHLRRPHHLSNPIRISNPPQPNQIAFLQQHANEKTIVYFLTCACVEAAALALRRRPELKGQRIAALHGRMKQAQREAALSAFAEQPAGARRRCVQRGSAVSPRGQLMRGCNGGAADVVTTRRRLHRLTNTPHTNTHQRQQQHTITGALLCTDLAARGLDIPDVGWVFQYDPPQDPAAFVHRAGRTARMGRSGASLALLLPAEAAFVDLMRLRRVPLVERERLEGAPTGVGAWLRSEAETDREAMDKWTRAFVSFVRGYKEHHLKYIFRVQDLPLGRLAASMGLLRLPRMQETKRAAGEGFEPSKVDPESVPFRDKAREKQRQRQLKERAAAEAAAAAAANSDGKQQQHGGNNKRGRDGGRGGGKHDHQQQQPPEEKLPAAKRRQLQQRDELAELTRDYKLLKKLKRGKISDRAFDVATGISSASEDEGGAGEGGGGGASDDEAAAAALAADGGSVGRLLAKKKKKQKKKNKRRGMAAGGSGGGGGG